MAGCFVKTERHAEVDLKLTACSRIRYIDPTGPLAVFGATEVKGTTTVDPVTREITYRVGERMRSRKSPKPGNLALDLWHGAHSGAA